MIAFYKIVEDGFVTGVGTNGNDSVTEITEAQYLEILSVIHDRPTPPAGHTYLLRADNLDWELVEMQTAPITEDEALTRYANELTGGSDETLEAATETLLKIMRRTN